MLIVSTEFILLCRLTKLILGFESTLGHIRPAASDDVQEKAVKSLIQRLLGNAAEKFQVMINSSFIDVSGKEIFMVNY